MNKQSKRALRGGIVLLALFSAVLVVYLNWAYASANSNRAHLTISQYEVGTNYAGVITQQYVTTGQTVQQGQKLFMLKSDDLTQALKTDEVTAADLIYPLSNDGQMVVLAGKSGIVSEIDAPQGSFAPADRQIASIADTSTLGITADFSLDKTQQNQLTPATPLTITLPSHRKVLGQITSILQTTENGRQVTTVQASISPSAITNATALGSQVQAKLTLDQSTYYQRLLANTQTLMSRWRR